MRTATGAKKMVRFSALVGEATAVSTRPETMPSLSCAWPRFQTRSGAPSRSMAGSADYPSEGRALARQGVEPDAVELAPAVDGEAKLKLVGDVRRPTGGADADGWRLGHGHGAAEGLAEYLDGIAGVGAGVVDEFGAVLGGADLPRAPREPARKVVGAVLEPELDGAENLAHLELDGLKFLELIGVAPSVSRRLDLPLDAVAVVGAGVVGDFPDFDAVAQFAPDDGEGAFTTAEVAADKLEDFEPLPVAFPSGLLALDKGGEEVEVQREDDVAADTDGSVLRARGHEEAVVELCAAGEAQQGAVVELKNAVLLAAYGHLPPLLEVAHRHGEGADVAVGRGGEEQVTVDRDD